MTNNLEEITVHEVNRIGARLNNDLDTVLEANLIEKNDELEKYSIMYATKIKKHNEFVRETNTYLPDHNIKYYIDKDTGNLTYDAIKKEKIGF